MKVFKQAQVVKNKNFGELILSEDIVHKEMNDSDNLLYLAIRQGNVALAQYLVENGSTLGTHKYTPFMLACYLGQLEVAGALFTKKDLNDRDQYGNTPLMYAVRNGHIKVAEWLVSLGADVNAVNINGDSALFIAIRFKHPLTALFLMGLEDIKVNTADVLSYKPIVMAIFNSYLEIAESLPHNKMVLNKKYTENNTLLHMCAMSNNLESGQWLLDQGVDVQPLNSYGFTPLVMAAARGHIQFMELLLNKLPKNKALFDDLEIAIAVASTQGHLNVVNLALKYKDKFSTLFIQFVLMNAASHGHWDIMDRMLDIDKGKMVRRVNKHYNYGDYEFNHGGTLLHAAAEKGELNVVQNLVIRGARLDAINKNHDTVLHHAVRSGNLELVRWICNHNILVNAANKQGNTALHLAIQMNSSAIIRCLLIHGATVKNENNQKETEEFLARLHPKLNRCFKEFSDRDYKNFGLTKLHEAVMDGQDKAILEVLPIFHDIHVRSVDGTTPIQLAANIGNVRALVVLLLWQVQCNRNAFYVIAEELQKKYDPKSKAHATFHLAMMEMRTFPQHRITALSSLAANIDAQKHDKEEGRGKGRDREHIVIEISSPRFFRSSGRSLSQEANGLTLIADEEIQLGLSDSTQLRGMI